jgi:hypothetical protein
MDSVVVEVNGLIVAAQSKTADRVYDPNSHPSEGSSASRIVGCPRQFAGSF